MGVMTLADFRADLQTALQRTVSNTLLDKWVNNAIREFAYAFKFRELEDTYLAILPAGNGTFTFAGTFRAIHEDGGVRITAPADKIAQISPETRARYLQLIGDTTDSATWGTPLFYHKYGFSVFVRPVVDATYNLTTHIWKKITPLVAGSDVSQFDEDWDDVIFNGALYRGFKSFGEFDRWQNVKAEFVGLVRSRTTEMELEKFPTGGVSPLGPNDTESSIPG